MNAKKMIIEFEDEGIDEEDAIGCMAVLSYRIRNIKSDNQVLDQFVHLQNGKDFHVLAGRIQGCILVNISVVASNQQSNSTN